MENKNFLIIDSNSVIHRAFHALPQLRTKKGDPVNAVYGFLLVFLKTIREFQPDYIAACFDFPAPTFRHQKFKEYKAKRPPTPKELAEQMPKIKNVLNAFGVKIFEKEGFEADDLIASLKINPKKFFQNLTGQENQKSEINPSTSLRVDGEQSRTIKNIIVSGDSDLLQLVDEQTEVYLLKKGVKDTILCNEEGVKKKYQGLLPEQLLDFKALRGDPSDNIPGVKGIGEKTALKLIKEFGTLENLYSALFGVNQRLRALLEEQKEQAFLSYSLAEMKKDVPLEFVLENCRWGENYYDEKKAVQELNNLEFYSLVEKLPKQKEEKKINGKLKLW